MMLIITLLTKWIFLPQTSCRFPPYHAYAPVFLVTIVTHAIQRPELSSKFPLSKRSNNIEEEKCLCTKDV